MEDNPWSDPRVYLAAERTVLAWIRTGIALMGLGFIVARFGFLVRELDFTSHVTLVPQAVSSSLNASSIGVLIVAAGVLINLWASIRHVRMVRAFSAGRPFDTSAKGPVTLGIATAAGGLTLVVVLIAAVLR